MGVEPMSVEVSSEAFTGLVSLEISHKTLKLTNKFYTSFIILLLPQSFGKRVVAKIMKQIVSSRQTYNSLLPDS